MSEIYSEKAYELAKKNTKYNEAGRAVISNEDKSVLISGKTSFII